MDVAPVILLTILILTAFGIFIAYLIKKQIEEEASIKERIRELSDKGLETTPDEFFKIRKATLGSNLNKYVTDPIDFSGVYILYNKTKNKYYVGQDKNMFQRVNSHLTGHGNGDVYVDYKTGDEFTVILIALKISGFSTLNELERHFIRYYNAYSQGYNKTRGNSG